MEKLEKMADFFASRVSFYDKHMLEEVGGCREGYIEMARHVPYNARRLLDLGCGTGLELEAVFEKLPEIEVTGIDLCEEMLLELKRKYANKKTELICGDYFTVDFGEGFDCALSFQTMHHFKKEKKQKLYEKICSAIKKSGVYIECDYMVDTQQEEDLWFSEGERLRRQQGIGEDEFYHYDTPCSVENQIMLLKNAGFTEVTQVMKVGTTVMLAARRG